MTLSQAEMFKILGVENRIRIIELLKKKGPLGVNELSKTLEITPSAVSQHLKILRHAGFVRNERKGYWVPYKVNEEALEQCQELLSEVCSCGCQETSLIHEAQLDSARDPLPLLKDLEKKLLKELQQVRCRIEQLTKER